VKGPSATVGQVALVAGLASAIGVLLAVIPGHRGWFDVGVYHGAVGHWVGGGQLYDYLRPGTHYGFTYPPFAALCLLPLSLLGWHPAVAASVLVNAAAAALLLYWLVVRALPTTPAGAGRPRWLAACLAACLLALFEPARDTVSFGQVNLALLALICADLRLLTSRHARWAGIGIGLAAAVKLTPALFIVYLLVTRQRRAAAVAAGTALGATALAGLLAPHATATFFTDALWQTSRVGSLSYVSNQSIQGVLARLDPDSPSRLVWLAAALVLLAVWGCRARLAVAAGDQRAGFALTGVAACLVSPVTWVHHLVWYLPALALLAERTVGERPDGTRRRPLLAVISYALMCSGVVWLFSNDFGGPLGFVGGNAYVWIGLALLLFLPLNAGERAGQRLVRGEEAGDGALPAEPLGARPRGGPAPLDRTVQHRGDGRGEVVAVRAEPGVAEHPR
jgi:alpha-1,2-mannosyltransferase